MFHRIVAGTIATMAFLVAPVPAQSPQDLIDRQSQPWGNVERQLQLQDSQWRERMLQRQQLEQMRRLTELLEQKRQRELLELERQRERQPICQPWRR